MTYRTIWTPLSAWWPEHRDFDTEDDANRFALHMSREVGGEVSVHLLPERPIEEQTA